MTMKLNSLRISRSYSNDDLTGIITFKSEHGEVSLELTDEDCQPILDHCADAVVASSRRVAECLTTDTINRAIEHKPEEEVAGA